MKIPGKSFRTFLSQGISMNNEIRHNDKIFTPVRGLVTGNACHNEAAGQGSSGETPAQVCRFVFQNTYP